MSGPPKITITKKLEEEIRSLARGGEGIPSTKVARQLVARIDDARARKEMKSGMNPWDVIRIVKAIVPATVVPPDPGAILARVKQKVALLSLTDELVERAAHRAKRECRMPMSIAYFVSQLDVLIREEEDPEVTNDSDGEAPVVHTGRF